jgi:Sigma-70 region 2
VLIVIKGVPGFGCPRFQDKLSGKTQTLSQVLVTNRIRDSKYSHGNAAPFHTSVATCPIGDPVIVSMLSARMGDRAAVQEVALTAFQKLADYDETRSFTAWVLGIANHKAIDWLRANGPWTHWMKAPMRTALLSIPPALTRYPFLPSFTSSYRQTEERVLQRCEVNQHERIFLWSI